MISLSTDELFKIICGAVGGIVITVLTQRVLGKRGLFTYFVRHTRVGLSTDDEVFGTVRVTWNNSPLANLYLSTVELKNESLQDFEGVVVRVFTQNATLLTERTEVLDTAQILNWTKDFSNRLHVAEGAAVAPYQQRLFDGSREYYVTTMNRGQVLRFTYLNVGKGDEWPRIWIDLIHKGVKLRYREAHEEFMGIPRPAAVVVGTVSGLFAIVASLVLTENAWVAASVSYLYGLLVIVPGALLLKLWRWLREIVGG